VRYELPFGSGQRWGSQWNGVTDKLLGGWAVSTTQTARTGLPINLTMTPRQSRCGAQSCQERPDLIPGGNNNPVLENWTPEKYFDASQFAVPALGYFGNVGRLTLISPGIWNLDFSLNKRTQIAEAKNLEFRAEFFNALNHPNFGVPNAATFQSAAGALSPTSGRITTTSNFMRQMQFSLKLTF
ncbi:MAG: carboxypeptidase regulatory-like domain-containing protein, partial [Acidobacteria bacterium]|nr:carboxypeptidase regulatory-like domain-containing protein [Acidobacteriota bacterium]